MKRHIIFLIFSICTNILLAQESFRTEVLSSNIKSLQIRNAADWYAPPVIELNSDNFLEINFDELSHDYMDYYYTIVHCNADWKPSMLSLSEYLTGFDNNPVEDYVTSFNTQVDYTHYRITLPNDRVGFRVSGNYVLSVYRADDRNNIVLRTCFSIIEKQVNVGAGVNFSTDIDHFKKHQQLSVNVNYMGYPVQNAMTDLKVFVYQNNRPDNAVQLKQPYLISNNQITYEHSRDLIFEGGNEFRRFECVNFRYNGIGVERVDYLEPYTHVSLYPDQSRTNNYSYDQDQDGRYMIRTSQGSDDNSEGEYMYVHFTLPWDDPLSIQGSVYLNGEFTHYAFDNNSKMMYNFEQKAFEKSILLKQGSYNYQYLVVPKNSEKGQIEPIEGNFYQTENEYRIMVYHRPVGGRYDKLVGIAVVQSK